jgi:hypothetical protein
MAKGPSEEVKAAAIQAAVKMLLWDKNTIGMPMGELAKQVASLAYAVAANFHDYGKDGFDIPKSF